MKIISLVKYVKEPRLSAVVADKNGDRRRIETKWWTKENTPHLQDSWLSDIEGECKFQESSSASITVEPPAETG